MVLKLFFALFPDPATAAVIARRIKSTCAKYGFSGHPITVDRLHVTLHHIGDYEDQLPVDLVDSLERVAATLAAAPFDVTFDQALSFAGHAGNPRKKHPYVITARDQPQLRAFHGVLGDAISAGMPNAKASRSFTPHLTLVWDEKIIPEHPVRPIRWTAREFALVKSFVGRSRYEILNRWALDASATASPPTIQQHSFL